MTAPERSKPTFMVVPPKGQPLSRELAQQVPLESNRPLDPRDSFRYGWELAFVRRGHPIRQLVVEASIVCLVATLVQVVKWSPILLGALSLLLVGLTLSAIVAVMADKDLIGHSTRLSVVLAAAVLIGLL